MSARRLARGQGSRSRHRPPVRHLLSALSRSELGAGDVLVATTKQDCSGSSNPSEPGQIGVERLPRHHQGWDRAAWDPAHAHKAETGQNAHWDADKKQWINSKNGRPLTPETLSSGEIAKGLFFGYLGRSVCEGGRIGPWKLAPSDPYHAHNTKTGQNAFFDTDKRQWIDAKTGKALTPDP